MLCWSGKVINLKRDAISGAKPFRDLIRLGAIVLLTWLLIGGQVAMGQAAAGQTVDSPPAAEAQQATAIGDSRPPADVLSQPITLHLKGADIRDVLRLLARISGVNIVAQKDVTGPVTVSLDGVRFERALDLVIKVNGFDYRWVDGVVVVSLPGKLDSAFSRPDTRVVALRYADPDSVRQALGTSFPNLRIAAEKRSRSLSISGAEEDVQGALAVIAELDRPVSQVLFEARIEEITDDAKSDLGFDWSFSVEPGAGTIGQIPVPLVHFEQKLSALENAGKANLLARPRLAVVDGSQGKIMIGDRVPIMVTEVREGVPVTRIEYIDAGIQLDITASISSDGYVTSVIKPQVSSITDWTPQGIPQIRTREASTTVRIKDGETIAIGGLLQTETVDSTSNVPLLSKLPVIGTILFQHGRKTTRTSEIVIFLTPHIISPGGA